MMNSQTGNKTNVSVCIITYNHEKFINKCIDGVLNQKTAYSFEIVIGEDFSTDNNRSICQNYAKKHPSKIRLIENSKNIGVCANWINTIQSCTSKYFAILEGDDYWIDENKLQKQFDFMEAHPEVSFCYTDAYLFIDGNEEEKEVMIKNKPDQNIFDLDYYINGGCFFIPTLTLFIRKDAFPDPVPEWLYKTFNLDWALNILYLQKGKAAYLGENTAMYRKHFGGISLATYFPTIVHNALVLLKNLDQHFNNKYHHAFGKNQWRYHQLVVFYFQKRKYAKGFYWLFYSFFRNPKAFLTNLYFLKTLYKVIFQGFEVNG